MLFQDHLKELAGLHYKKEEPFSSLDENDNEQSLVMEQKCDIESKPLIKQPVAFAPFTPQKGVALPAVSCNVVLNVYKTIICLLTK
jgi:hypothetical protein